MTMMRPTRIVPRFRLNNITPFTYRDGLTYLQVIEEIKDKLVEVIDSHNEWGDAVDDLITDLDNHTSELKTELADETSAALDTITSHVAQSAESLNNLLVELTGQLVSVGDDSQASMLSILSDAEDVLSNVMEISGLTGEDGAVAQLLNMVSTATHNAALSVAHLGSIRLTTEADDNFDNLVTGIYYVPFGSHLEALGLPQGDHGILIVVKYGFAGMAYFVPRSSGVTYRMTRLSGEWQSWVAYDSLTEQDRTRLDGAITFRFTEDQDVDFDSLGAGIHYVAFSAQAQALGLPTPGRGTIFITLYGNGNGAAIYLPTDNGNIYRRSKTYGAWGDWKPFDTTGHRLTTDDDTDFDSLETGSYYVPFGAHAEALGLPFTDHGFLQVEKYGFAGAATFTPRSIGVPMRIARVGGEWQDWKEVVPRDHSVNNSYARHEYEVTRHMSRIGAPIDVGSKTPIAIVWDDYPAAMRDNQVVSLATQYDIPITFAICSRTLDPGYERLVGGNGDPITWAEIDSWVGGGIVELANHGATHTPSRGQDEMYDEIVTGLSELRSHSPSGEINTWVMPDNNWPGITDPDGASAWSSDTGRLILGHHAFATGWHPVFPDRTMNMVGKPVNGQNRKWIEAVGLSRAQRQNIVTSMYGTRRGAILSAHAEWIGQEGRWDVADVESFFAWLAGERLAGRVELMHLSKWAFATVS